MFRRPNDERLVACVSGIIVLLSLRADILLTRVEQYSWMNIYTLGSNIAIGINIVLIIVGSFFLPKFLESRGKPREIFFKNLRNFYVV